MVILYVPVSARDQILISRAKSAAEANYQGAATCADPGAVWLRFRFSDTLRQNSCAVVPVLLPNRTLSPLPQQVTVERTTPGEVISVEPLDTKDGPRIPIGNFPPGNVEKVTIRFADGAEVQVTDTRDPGRFRDQRLLRFEFSDTLRVFPRQVLQAVRRVLGERDESDAGKPPM